MAFRRQNKGNNQSNNGKNELPSAATFFAEMRSQDPTNNECFECSRSNPQWASVPYGIYICLECSGKHRSIGVHLSFVRSLTMDNWTPKQRSKMRVGGNANLKKHFEECGVYDIADLSQKYSTTAAKAYKSKIEALANGNNFTMPPIEDLKAGTASVAPQKKALSQSVPRRPRGGYSPNFSNRGNHRGGRGNHRGRGGMRHSGDNFGRNQGNNFRGNQNSYGGNGNSYGGNGNGFGGNGGSSISSNSISSDMYGPPRRSQGYNNDVGETVSNGVNGLVGGISNAGNVAAEKLREVDVDEIAKTVKNTGEMGWNMAVDFFNTAKSSIQSTETYRDYFGGGYQTSSVSSGGSYQNGGYQNGGYQNNSNSSPYQNRSSSSSSFQNGGGYQNKGFQNSGRYGSTGLSNSGPQEEEWDMNW
eukprot:TRINITY_DN4851_c2_g1_i1.p1 TRINITY_DN4851_c2_g1~~TRINITY_DN4851_c2_g1_i1.p1  ORF type:complete len:430 (+),score=92.73 TRINITY_DN4851_c2_g1_i1:45-1292(+)